MNIQTIPNLLEAGNTDAHTPPALSDLAKRINDAHAAAHRDAQSAIEHARACGEMLLQAKEAIGHGGFLAWLSANCRVGERQARNYMRVAREWVTIGKSAPGSDLTIKEAIRLTSKETPLPAGQQVRAFIDLPPEGRRELCEKWWDILASKTLIYDAAGWSVDEIADAVCMPLDDVEAIIAPQLPPFSAGAAFGEFDHAEYAKNVWRNIHSILSTCYFSAASSCENEGFGHLEGDLMALYRSHQRKARRQPLFPYEMECWSCGAALNWLPVDDARFALRIVRSSEHYERRMGNGEHSLTNAVLMQFAEMSVSFARVAPDDSTLCNLHQNERNNWRLINSGLGATRRGRRALR